MFCTASFAQVDKQRSEVPDWLLQKIGEHNDDPRLGFVFSEYKYKNRVVYIQESSQLCCDLGKQMYSISGERICQFIGIAGSWGSECDDFIRKGQFVRNINIRGEIAPNNAN